MKRSRSPRLVVPVVVAVGIGVIALALILTAGGAGGRESRSGPLAWAERPRVDTPATLPDDRVLTGRLRNDSLRRVRIRAGDVRLVTADGARVEGTAAFVGTFLHGLYPPTREPRRLSEPELRRLGRLAVIEPRRTVPVTLAWRLRRGRTPERVDYGQGALPLPR